MQDGEMRRWESRTDTGDLWLCLLWCSEGICDTRSRKSMEKRLLFNTENHLLSFTVLGLPSVHLKRSLIFLNLLRRI